MWPRSRPDSWSSGRRGLHEFKVLILQVILPCTYFAAATSEEASRFDQGKVHVDFDEKARTYASWQHFCSKRINASVLKW